MTETVTCPADGCDYDGVESSVLGHYSGKQDDDHSGGYEHAKTLLNGDAPAQTDDSTGGSGDGGNPTFGEVDDDGTDGTDGSDEAELPCGHDSYDESEAPEPPYRVSCPECEQSWVVNE